MDIAAANKLIESLDNDEDADAFLACFFDAFHREFMRDCGYSEERIAEIPHFSIPTTNREH